MPTITERKLEFTFPDDWQVVAYDRHANPVTGEPASFYRRVVEKGGVTDVCGMDIVCRLPSPLGKLQFIEVKDDRKRVLTTGPRHAELFARVMQKTAGTLAGLLLAERLGDASLHAHACLSQKPEIEVVLFLVEPAPLLAPTDPAENGLYLLPRKERMTGLSQRLSAKLFEWDFQFNLYNLTPEKQRHAERSRSISLAQVIHTSAGIPLSGMPRLRSA